MSIIFKCKMSDEDEWRRKELLKKQSESAKNKEYKKIIDDNDIFSTDNTSDFICGSGKNKG